MQDSGIYKLEFSDSTYYIGQTVDLNSRKREHYRLLLLNKHHNYRVQEKYNKLQILPTFNIITHCDIKDLDKQEDILIDLTDKFCLNIKAGGNNNYGYNALTAKYLISDIEIVFLLLVNNPGISHKIIADFTGVDISTVHDISAGRNRAFTEMKTMYPELYEKLLKIKANNTRGKVTIVLEHTDGRIVTLKSGEYTEFCKLNKVQNSNLSKLISGSRKSTMGWKLLNKYENF